MTKKKSITMICIATLLIAFITISVSYAYWKTTLVQTESNEIATSCFQVNMVNQKNEINLEYAFPISDGEALILEPFYFEITNTCDLSSNYSVNLESLAASTTDMKFIDVMLNSGEVKRLKDLPVANKAKSDSKDSRVIATGLLNPGATKKFNIRIWVDKDVTKEDNIENTQFIASVVVSNEPTTEILVRKKCIRAESLHTEQCASTICQKKGYTIAGSKNTETIVYGSLGTNGTLALGDAFTCDVNGDGNHDEETERFYYLYQDDEERASLIYYSNVYQGEPNNTETVPYITKNDLLAAGGSLTDYLGTYYLNVYKGPLTAMKELPTVTQWSNVSLKNELYRSNIDYSGYAAKIPSFSELNSNGIKPLVAEFLLENTAYSNPNNANGYWTDNTCYMPFDSVTVSASYDTITEREVDISTMFGVRPVIEVLLSDMEY